MMKSFNITSILTILTLFLSISVFADTEKTSKEKDAPRELKNQTHCPVMGGEIDSTVYTDIQGQRVYLCCPMCSKKLTEDPDKYFKKAAEEGILFENIQKTCPISGEILEEKSVYSDYEGRRVYFCCNKCRGTFNEDPGKILSLMDGKPEEKKTMQHDDHSGHNH